LIFWLTLAKNPVCILIFAYFSQKFAFLNDFAEIFKKNIKSF